MIPRYEVTIQETRVIKIGVRAESLDDATELASAALEDYAYSGNAYGFGMKHAELVELIEAQILSIKKDNE